MSTAAMLESDWNAGQVKRPAWEMPDFPEYEKTPAFNSRDNRTDWGEYTEFTDGSVYRRPMVRSKVKATVKPKPKPKVKVDLKNNEMPRLVNDKVPCIMDYTKTYGNNSKVTFRYESGGAKLPAMKNIDKIDKMSDEELMPPPPCPGGRDIGRGGVLWLSKKAGWRPLGRSGKKNGN
ncbi:MAG: hypothetical protein GY830_03920 [Bacteroidetes bacterium]|nr:hypothetical protein [Bacteroidota bacterium]